ncbi:MAG: hypothetical protein AAF078_00185 [Planctomycetota bacterium]
MTSFDASDPRLVQLITEQVVRAIQSAGRQPTAIAPPLGHCPGGVDPVAAPAQAPATAPVTVSLQADAPQVTPLDNAPVLDGLLTAHQVEDALAASPDGRVILAATARLTPLAQDHVRRAPHKFTRRNLAADHTTLQTVNHGQPWLWWTCGRCPAVQKIVAERRSRMLSIIAPREPAALPAVLTDLSGAIASGRAAGGVLFVAAAAKPLCLANRLRPIRAILGHCDNAVREGIRDLGANVLVLEFPHLDHDQMAARTDALLGSAPAVPAAIAHGLHTVEGSRA